MRQVARQFHVSLSTVQLWVQRAGDRRLERVDWTDHSSAPLQPARKIELAIETHIVALRKALKEKSALGEYGAGAIRHALLEERVSAVPCERTIHRVLDRQGLLDPARRVRRPAPPPGWYLPEVARREAELDQIDIVEGLVIRGGIETEVLNIVSLCGGLTGCFPSGPIRSEFVREVLVRHWQAHGRPAYAQFDNDTRFLGPSNHPDIIGSVARLCLCLGVVPVFAPPRETGFQAAIESLNNRWQRKVWDRFEHGSLAALGERSDLYVDAALHRHASRIAEAPDRHPFPPGPVPGRKQICARPTGRLIFIRRADNRGHLKVLGHSFCVGTQWPNRLVRCEMDLDADKIQFCGLRRVEPASQPVLCEECYHLPDRPFRFTGGD